MLSYSLVLFNYVQKRFYQLEEKFERYQSPGDISARISRILRELQSIENTICLLELASDDPDSIKGQLDQSLVRIFCINFGALNTQIIILQIDTIF